MRGKIPKKVTQQPVSINKVTLKESPINYNFNNIKSDSESR